MRRSPPILSMIGAWAIMNASCEQLSHNKENDMNTPAQVVLEEKGWALAFAPDGKRLFMKGDFDGRIGAWDVKTRKRVLNFHEANDRGGKLTISADGKTLVSGGSGGIFIRWQILEDGDTKQLDWMEFPHGGKSSTQLVGTSIDGGKLLVRTKPSPPGKTIFWMWDVKTKRVIPVYDPSESTEFGGLRSPLITDAASSPDLKQVAFLMDVRLAVIDSAGKSLSVTMQGPENARNLLLYSPDGRLFSFDDRIILHAKDNVDIDQQSEPYRDTNGNILIIRTGNFSADSRLFAGGMSWANMKPGYVVVWDTKAWKQIALFKASDRNLTSVCLSPDGHTVATADEDNVVSLWDMSDFIDLKK